MESKGVSYQAGTSMNDDDFLTSTRRNPRQEAVKPAGSSKKLTKYVSKSTSTKKDLESDLDEEEATDNLLGRLRNGMRLIQTHARETMAKCDTDESRVDMAQRLESSHLKMMRAEKSFLSTNRLIAEVVDEFVSDYEDESEEDINSNDTKTGAGENETPEKTDDSSDTSKALSELSLTKKSSHPVIFRPTMANSKSIISFGRKLSKILDERQTKYDQELTDDILRREKKFCDLRQQIHFGIQDAENTPKQVDIYSGAGDMDLDDLAMISSSISNTTYLRFDSEDEDYDESVLPSTDPISLEPIFTAVRNKFCNHVFDKTSISSFMMQNPNAKCPMIGCRNDRPLSSDHLIFEKKLTDQIRQKNNKLM